jgi:hypothetical protein
MSYRTHCDWCGKHLPYDADQAELSVTIYHRKGKSRLDATWSEEVDVTRHFCAPDKEDLDRGGRNRMGMTPDQEFDSCYHRAVAVITGRELREPNMGLEWRLIPTGDDQNPPTRSRHFAPRVCRSPSR